jgi:site-specific recombinase XerC
VTPDLPSAIEAFLAYGDAAGHTAATRKTYAYVLLRLQAAGGAETVADLTPGVMEAYLARLRGSVCPVSVHQAFRTLRTFVRWCVRTGRLATDPMAGLVMRTPKTLPTVPEDAAVRRLLAACPPTSEGHRNRALVALLADSGLRKEELRRLRLGDLYLMRRLIHVYAGLGSLELPHIPASNHHVVRGCECLRELKADA